MIDGLAIKLPEVDLECGSHEVAKVKGLPVGLSGNGLQIED